MANISPGFAIRRNGTCLALETDCGGTQAPFRGCCPPNLACPQQYNVACCPQGKNCTAELVAAPKPRCANATWNLYDNNGFFCCEKGESAYDRQNTDVCAQPGAQLKQGDRVLGVVRVGEDAATVSSSLSGMPTISISSLGTLNPSALTLDAPSGGPASNAATRSSSSSPPAGAIAGGVVGGIAVISVFVLVVWFLLRRRRDRKAEKNPYLQYQRHEVDAASTKYRMDAHHVVHEADGTAPGYLHARELPAYQKPVELPAEEVDRSKKN